jgi:hypothetical protein
MVDKLKGYRELYNLEKYFYEYKGKKVKPSFETFVKSLKEADYYGGDPYVVRGGKILFLDAESTSKQKFPVIKPKKTTAKKATTTKVVSKSPTATRKARVTSCAKKITAIRRILKSK